MCYLFFPFCWRISVGGWSETTLGCRGGNVVDTHCITPVAANHRKKGRGKGGKRRNSGSSNQEALREFSRISDF